MKQFTLCIIIFATIISCKKEIKIAENSKIIENNTPNSTEKNTIIPFKKIEISAEQTTKFLAKQNNDTLYVTNFFATWCGPCVKEIPHFVEKMEELKEKPVKFTFVDLDEKSDWDLAVKDFAEEHHISKNTILLDGATLKPEFFKTNFKTWDGGSIPFTIIRKGDKTDETMGMMSKEILTEKINSFN